MYERGKRIPRDEVKIRIAQHFNVSLESIFLRQASTISAERRPTMKPKPERVGQSARTLAQLPVFEYKGKLVADSRDIAAMIERPHWIIMRTIRTMNKHLTDNKFVVSDYFIEATYIDPTGRELPNFYCTEMGCDMAANKQEGERGTIFTAQYVKAFHAMRALLLERASPIWQDTRSLGKEVRRRETNAIKRLVDYATAQGSRNASRYYTTLSKLADRTAGIVERDRAQVVQLTTLLLVEKIIAQEIKAGIDAERPYKEIYQAVKDRLSAVSSVGALAGEEAHNDFS